MARIASGVRVRHAPIIASSSFGRPWRATRTWHDRHGLQGSQDAERSQHGHVAQVDEEGEVSRSKQELERSNRRLSYVRESDDNEIQPVPGIAQEGELLQDEASRQAFGQCFERVDEGEDVPRGSTRACFEGGCRGDLLVRFRHILQCHKYTIS